MAYPYLLFVAWDQSKTTNLSSFLNDIFAILQRVTLHVRIPSRTLVPTGSRTQYPSSELMTSGLELGWEVHTV